MLHTDELLCFSLGYIFRLLSHTHFPVIVVVLMCVLSGLLHSLNEDNIMAA